MTWQFLATGEVQVSRDEMSDHFVPEVTILILQMVHPLFAKYLAQYLLELELEHWTTRENVLIDLNEAFLPFKNHLFSFRLDFKIMSVHWSFLAGVTSGWISVYYNMGCSCYLPTSRPHLTLTISWWSPECSLLSLTRHWTNVTTSINFIKHWEYVW